MIDPRRRPLVRLLPAATALALLLGGSRALARGGGGEHYTGPSGDGGGDGDGGAILEIFWLLMQLTFAYPHVMLPVWVVIIGVIWWSKRSMPGERTQRGMQALEQSRLLPARELDAQMEALRRRDPAFEPQAFLERSARVFVAVQEAWFLRKLDGARQFMSDGLYRRFAVLQDLMTAEGRRDALANARVLKARVLRCEQTEAFDLLTVQVDASMHDVEVAASLSDDEALAAARRAPAGRFSEVWTFVRRPEARSRPGHDLSQGNCPNCGAPFTGGAANKCEYCGAIVNSGAFDWVLSEITQASEYLPHARAAGLEALHERDPDAAAEILEDRALLLFWKWVEAQSLGRPEALRKVATTEAFAAVASDLERHERPRGPALRVPSVGGADVTAVEVDSGGFDRVHVDVRWSAASAGEARSRPRRHVLTMIRASGARTDRGLGLSTERCGNCSAPLTKSDSVTCDYCGHDLASATKEWALAEISPYELWHRPAGRARAQRPVPAYATAGERLRLLQLMAAVARADGVVDRQEQRLLRAYASRWRISWEEVAPMLEGNGAVELVAPEGEGAEHVLATLVEAARVDGRIDRRERALIERAAAHLRAPAGTVERLVQ